MTGLTVLHLVANRWWTGSAEPVLGLVTALRAQGHRVLLGLQPGDRFADKAREASVEPLSDLALDGRFRPLTTARDLWRLGRLVRAEGVEVVHAHHSHDHWLAALACGRAALVRTFHCARAVRRGPSAAWLYARTAAAIAVSAEIEARCRRAGFEDGRALHVSGAVDLDRFTPQASGQSVRAEFKLGDAPLIGCVSRLASTRRHDLLLDAFRLLLGRLPAARLVLVGKGERKPALEARAVTMGLADRVVFAGYRDRDLPDVLAALDCFALLEPGSDESCRAVLEAMAAGRAVVARRVGALPETVVPGETGVLVDDDRPESVANALWTVLADRDRCRAMGAAGRRRVEREFTRARQVDAVVGIYRAVLGRR
jgi:glycosyltransferase involved in cell wall biosynthesis